MTEQDKAQPGLVAKISEAKDWVAQNQFKAFISLNIVLLWGVLIVNQHSQPASKPSVMTQHPSAMTAQKFIPDENTQPSPADEKQILVELETKAQTDTQAKLDLANAHWYGDLGAEQDKDKSLLLIRDAVKAGEGRALYMLGNFYFAGDFGRTHTFDVAYALWTLALEAGYEDGRTNYENVLLNIISQGQLINGQNLLQQMREFGVLEALDDYTK